MFGYIKRVIAAVVICFISAAAPVSAADLDAAALAKALKSGDAFAIMRHAIAPGFSDPDEFEIGKCETQRNLSNEGREQSRRIGKWFKRHGINAADVFTSQWCRCRDTARLLGLGPIKDLPALNSFFENRQDGQPQTKELRRWLAARLPLKRPLVLVTHQVNISALAGTSTSSGETLIVEIGPDAQELKILGSFVQ
ncbi:MAG: histidine phosphatase family protein [Alphaproteobacteria bacterium]|nr:histidine phosphatase family protein [Alphaproteobacteria bacterium]